MTRLRQLGAALVLVTGLAGCGVAVDQRSLQTTAASTAPAPATKAMPAAAGEPDDNTGKAPAAPAEITISDSAPALEPSLVEPPSDSAADPGGDSPSTQIGSDVAAAPLAPDPDKRLLADGDGMPDTVDEVAIASLAPSAAASIEDLLKSAEAANAARTAPAVTDDEIGVTPPDVTEADDGTAAPQAETGVAEDVVGNIIWNLEAANRARPPPPPEPQIPVGPDPSLASDALEAAFAMLARREYALPDDVFVLPPKAAGTTRIALLIPVTGPNAALGVELQHGAELALFSVRDPRIELLVFDTHGDGPDVAASQAVVAKADIIVGPLFSDAVVKARGIARAANIPMLALSNNLKIADRGSWLLGYVPEQQVDVLLGYALTSGRNRVGIIVEDSAFGRILAGQAVDRLTQFGLRPEASLTLTDAMLADEEQLKAAIQSFTGYQPPAEGEAAPAFSDLPPARFDSLLFAGSADFALRTAPVLAYYDADSERVLYLGNAQWNQQRILTEPSLQGGVFASRPTGRDDAFNGLWSQVWPSRPGALARLSFDAMAMATVLTGQKRQLWQAALESESGFSGFSGAYRLLPNGGNQRTFELRQISGGVSDILQPAPDKI